jgi:hypothetical protein
MKMQCKIEELPFLADFVRDNYVRDAVDFKFFSPVFGDSFLTKYDAQAKLVNGVVTPTLLISEQKAITQRISEHYTTARNFVNKIERYAKMADEEKLLKISVSDFGFKGIRKELDNDNDEGMVNKMGELKQLADANREALEPMGFIPAISTELGTFITTFSDDVKAQKRKMDQHAKLIKDNAGEFDILWGMISNILKTGKVIYKEKDKSKLKDYTYDELIKKVHQKRQSEEDNGEAPETKA